MSEVVELENQPTIKPASSGEVRAKVFALEDAMKTDPNFKTYELEVVHHFSQGAYGREMVIPKGTTVTGKIHKFTQLNVLLCGELSVLTEKGVVRIKPPFVVVSPPGTKRVAYAHEDSRWLTIHGTEETDVDKIEEKFIAQTEQEYLAFVEQTKQLQEKQEETICLGDR